MPTYDVHAHCIPADLLDMLRRHGSDFGLEVVDGERGQSAVLANGQRIGPFRSVLGDVDARLAKMDASGVDVQLISSWVDLTAYGMEPEHGAAYSRRFNEIMADEAGRHPGRFLALGTVPLQSPGHAAEELHHAVRELGMAGVEIATTVGQTDLDQAGLDPFWEAAAELRCLVLIHPCDPLSGVDLSRNFLDNMVGRPAESSITIGHLIFSGILERYPDLVVCVVHGGGFVPYQLGRMQQGYRAAPHMTAKNISTPPEDLARRLYYDTVLHDPAAIAFMVERMGVEQVVLGTDYPFEMGDMEPVATLDSVPGLTDTDRQLIREGNVARILEGIRR
ncbi:MAG TPA: amidohydrolase family protein [Acidimicrobiia bacterium]|nr:amidohydrolase family protein [Acidimicrobiia bacterium]